MFMPPDDKKALYFEALQHSNFSRAWAFKILLNLEVKEFWKFIVLTQEIFISK